MNTVYLDIVAGNTALGRIEIELFFDITSQTSENFRGLCTGEYGEGKKYHKKLTYRGSKILKIVDGNYIIGGDIVFNSGRGGESIYGEFFKDENFKRRHACAGLVSMNNFGKDKNNSQFIITLKACPQLDDKHVVFGHVVGGMNVVREIGKIPTDINNRPLKRIFIENCGDYDKRRINLKEDIFKETIDEIINERKIKEKIKIMDSNEILKYKKELEDKKNKEELGLDDDNDELSSEKENEDKENNIISNNLLKNISNDLVLNEKDNNEFDNNKNKIKKLDKEILKEYEDIELKINEAINMNTREVNLINYLHSENRDTNGENLYNYHRKSGLSNRNKEWLTKEEELNKNLVVKGIPREKKYLLESINHCDKKKSFLEKKKKREQQSKDLFNPEAYYRAYKKRLKDIPFDKELYEDEMKNGINRDKIESEAKKDLLKSNIEKQINNRKNYSRRKKYLEEEEVDYANERNQKLNQKLHRYFGEETKEIKYNLEMRTAF